MVQSARGKYDEITIEKIKSAIADGTVFEFLETRLGHDVDLSLLDSADRTRRTK